MAINESVIKPKTDKFALRIVKLYRFLCVERKEYIISKQLMRSGTSIGANVIEAQYGISKPDFRSKMSIALKEACETEYWINLLHEAGYLKESEFDSLMSDLKPIIKILVSIVKSSER